MLTKEEQKERRNYIGASEAAGVLGLSRWKTPLDIWAEKTGQIEPSQEETLAQWIGVESEDMVARRFTMETGKKVRRVPEIKYHKQYPFLACHLDRKIEGEDAVLECKTASAWKYREWEDDIPQEYIIQVYHQLACSGYQRAYIACLIGNQKFTVKEILRDEKVIADMVKKEAYFWENFVVPKVMPGQITARDGDILYQLFPVAEPESEVKLSDTANAICESLDSLQADQKSLEAQIEAQKNELRAMLGENEVGTTGRYRISWKNQITKRLDTKSLKEKEPGVYQEYLQETKSRVLRVTTLTGKEGE